jgi:hypothetical protein
MSGNLLWDLAAAYLREERGWSYLEIFAMAWFLVGIVLMIIGVCMVGVWWWKEGVG